MGEAEDTAALVERLRGKAKSLRLDVLRMIHAARSGHPGGSLSAADIVAVIFYHLLRHDPRAPAWPGRDKFILSKGHAAPILYAALADLGYFPREELATLRRVGGRLQGHPCRTSTPGVESSGSLGQGLSVGCGLAYAARLDRSDAQTYVLLGDGELNEGQIWEAAMFAGHYRLENLTAVVDRNRLQFVGATEEVMSLEPLAAKWAAFGWHVEEAADGNDIASLLGAFGRARASRRAPRVIIAKTVKGKGVGFMENDIAWHGAAPDDQQYAAAVRELGGGP